MHLRQPAVAGRFYTDVPADLRAEVESFLKQGAALPASALAAGATSAVVKGSSENDLAMAIRNTANGERVLSQEIAAAITLADDSSQLSERNVQILTYAAKGLSNSDIAQLLEISVDGVKNHFKTIRRKLNAATRGEAIAIAMRKGLIE